MSLPTHHNEWKIVSRLFYVESVLSRYTINFFKQDDEWVNEVRFDSHDRRHARMVLAPHFHLKIGTNFKGDPVVAVEEIRALIDNQLKQIAGAIGK